MTPLPRLLLPLLLTLSLTACGLFSGSGDEAPPADVGAAEGETDPFGFGEGDSFAFEEGDDFAIEGDDSFGDDIFGDSDFFGDDSAFPESPITDSTGPDAFATDESFGSDPFAAPEASDPFAAPDSSDPFAVDSTDTYASDSFESDEPDLGGFGSVGSFEDTSYDVEEPRAFVPVKKMADAAFRQGGTLLNRIYIIREGDTLSSVSQKIFGTDRSSDLVTWNPYFASNSPKVGDKVYYPSQNNPNELSMLTYYEDQGIAAQTYMASAGDNIRAISKDLLGHDRSWMEIWATNPGVESKGELYQDVSLRYWSAEVAAPVVADTPAPLPPPSSDDPFGAPADDIAASEPPSFDNDPFAMDQSLGGLNPPPPLDEDDDPFGAAATPPPPPPQVDELTLPPPPPPPARAQPTATAGAGDDNMILLVVGGGILGALLLIFFFIRRRRNSIDMGHTQV